MNALLWLIGTLITVYIWLLIAQAVLSWLLAFGVINRYNRGVAVISDFLYRITEPALRPIRSFLPNFGGIDAYEFKRSHLRVGKSVGWPISGHIAQHPFKLR